MKERNTLKTSLYSDLKIRLWLGLTFSIIALNNTFAQDNREDILGSWIVISGNNKIANRWSIPTVGVLRHYKLFENYEFSFFRSGLTYKIKDNSFLTIGAAYMDYESYVNKDIAGKTTQFWLYEEFVWNIKLKKAAISNRFRLENRWINKPTSNKINNRIRYRLQWKHPIHKNFYIKTFNEVFFNIENPHFDQNRFFLGLGYTISKDIKLETGYLKNHFRSAHYDRLRIAMLFKADFTKKKIELDTD